MFEKEAEEYAKDCEKEFHTSYGACLHSFKDGAEFGYNRGLKAGRPKWHDLMKDVNDLPLKHQRILCWTSDPWCHNQDGVKKGSHCNVEMGTYMGGGEWYIGCYHTCIPPKAWCEIPKYTEK